MVNESVSLGSDDLVVLDGEIAPQLPGLTPREAGRLTARAVIRIDADAARERAQQNRADQRVSMVPDTDGVAILQVRGPAEQILAAHTALDDHARGLRAAGDDRAVGQIMTQTLVERVTGQRYAEHTNVEVQLVMDAATFTAQDDGEPVDLTGYGPISPAVADDIIAGAPDAWIRRLLVDPVDGTLVVREPRRRHFDPPPPATSAPATAGADNPDATSRSGTATTSTPTSSVGSAPRTTVRASASDPTPSSICLAGPSPPTTKARPWSGRPPPATPTPPNHHRCSPTTNPATSANSRRSHDG